MYFLERVHNYWLLGPLFVRNILTLSTFVCHVIVQYHSSQVVHTPSQLRERLFLYEGFTDSFCGYSASKNPRKLVKYFERIQSQYNIAKDKV